MERNRDSEIEKIFDELKSVLKEKMNMINKEGEDEEKRDIKYMAGLGYWDGAYNATREILEKIHEMEDEYVEKRLTEESN